MSAGNVNKIIIPRKTHAALDAATTELRDIIQAGLGTLETREALIGLMSAMLLFTPELEAEAG